MQERRAKPHPHVEGLLVAEDVGQHHGGVRQPQGGHARPRNLQAACGTRDGLVTPPWGEGGAEGQRRDNGRPVNHSAGAGHSRSIHLGG